MDRVFVSGRWVQDKFGVDYYTLQKIVDAVGDEKTGRVLHPGLKRHRFVREKIEAVMMGTVK